MLPSALMTARLVGVDAAHLEHDAQEAGDTNEIRSNAAISAFEGAASGSRHRTVERDAHDAGDT